MGTDDGDTRVYVLVKPGNVPVGVGKRPTGRVQSIRDLANQSGAAMGLA